MKLHLPRSRRRRLLLPAISAVLMLLAVSCDQPDGRAVDENFLPADANGFNGPRVRNASYAKFRSDGVGAMRTNCSLSHMNYDDPIVFPGRERVTHLHAFFGNTETYGRSNSSSIQHSGNSTCTGGTANRSAYWVPAMIDTRNGRPMLPWGANGLQVYYKSGYRGVDTNDIVNFPTGLRMIAGNSKSTGPQPGIVSYHCASGGSHQTSMPNCAMGDRLVMSVEFPQCWDGVNLDSPDHKSHMAYGLGWPNRGCPASHPVALAQITQNFHYPVPHTRDGKGMSKWRLSSDMYDGPAGYSGHADWWNGWDASVFNRTIRGCFQGGFDCQMNLLGDGQVLH